MNQIDWNDKKSKNQMQNDRTSKETWMSNNECLAQNHEDCFPETNKDHVEEEEEDMPLFQTTLEHQ